MRIWHIEYYTNQINKLRGPDRLNDPINPPDKITKPVGMRTIIFDKRISRLKSLEKRTQNLIREGGEKFIKSRYKA